eukprot:TRINITY_DN4408_c0_g1_i1.p1 TRINITY_DN4408_c0_g1~~TRINITY_DN4408_c0_g1_i1.p1  ORF type:complete len:346 (+),score=46.27 TRINITY_DN4408_c0_g1_i1:105-1142(+)
MQNKGLDTAKQDPLAKDAGWIDVPLCEELVTKPIKFLLALDGTEESMAALEYMANSVLQEDRDTYVEVVHVYDDTKTYLPPAYRSESIRSTADAILTGAVTARRYRLNWIRRGRASAGFEICERIKEIPADYVCMGFVGRKRQRDTDTFASNLLHVISRGQCTVIVFKDESAKLLPIRRPTKYVVSVGVNKDSTKAFLDALRLSRPRDEIHVVYVRSYMEQADSDYTMLLRRKYQAFFESLTDESQEVFSRFHDRDVHLHIVEKELRETTSQAVVRYADDVEADFIVVGTNAMRVDEGKSAIGSVSLRICMETDRNFIVANWVDLDPRLYDQHVRAVSPATGVRP